MTGDGAPSVAVELEGLLEREVYASPERDYVVAELLARDGVRHTVAGSLAGCAIGDTVRCSAVPFDHPR
ncbi:MAG: hypothetical protein JNL90_17340, partial [Planctomycetes bacterium]|nr:hypothetical protein [Planctomycetota bacterium]